MTIPRIKYGRCSFIPPEGFAIQAEASLSTSGPSQCSHCIGEDNTPVSITLTRVPTDLEIPDFSEDPKDMDPNAYPSSITLMTHMAFHLGDPEHHLQETCRVLRSYLKEFTLHFCEKVHVGDNPAARSQYSFQSNFRIYSLNMAWIVGGESLTSTLTVTRAGVERGWDSLRGFSESVRI